MKHHKLNEFPEEPVTPLISRRFFTGDKMTMAFLTSKEGCVVPRHQHDSEQFSCCISGTLQFKIRGEAMILQASELVEIPSNVPHEAVVIEDFTRIAVFRPIRGDCCDGTENYRRQSNQAK